MMRLEDLLYRLRKDEQVTLSKLKEELEGLFGHLSTYKLYNHGRISLKGNPDRPNRFQDGVVVDGKTRWATYVKLPHKAQVEAVMEAKMTGQVPPQYEVADEEFYREWFPHL